MSASSVAPASSAAMSGSYASPASVSTKNSVLTCITASALSSSSSSAPISSSSTSPHTYDPRAIDTELDRELDGLFAALVKTHNRPRIKEGDIFPNARLDRPLADSNGTPTKDKDNKLIPNDIIVHTELGDDRVAFVGIPAAFSPTCSGIHLPSLIKALHKILALGIQRIICIAPCDFDTGFAWSKALGIVENPKIVVWADTKWKLTFKLGMAHDFSAGGRGLRIGEWRFMLIVNKLTAEKLFAEDAPGPCVRSGASEEFFKYLYEIATPEQREAYNKLNAESGSVVKS